MVRQLVVAVCDVATAVLAAAGLIKLFDPTPWVEAVRGLGLPVGHRSRRVLPLLARAVGVAELGVVVLVVFAGGEGAFAALAACYGSFCVVSAVAWRRGGVSCGCFGSRSAPMSGTHVVANVVIAVGATAAAAIDAGSLVERLDDGAGASIAYLLFALLGAAVLTAVMTSGAELLAITRTVGPRTAPRPLTHDHGAHR